MFLRILFSWQASLERVLMVWATRHLASGYVQVHGHNISVQENRQYHAYLYISVNLTYS